MMRILKSLFLISAVVAVVGGATYAYFSDTETSEGNTVTAGTLDLKVGGKDDPLVEKISVGDIYPGSVVTKTWKVENAGSVPGKVKVKIRNIADNDNGCEEPESPGEIAEYGLATCGAGEGELSSYLRTRVFQSHVNSNNPDWGINDYHSYNLAGRHPGGSPYGGVKYIENLSMGGQLTLNPGEFQVIKLDMRLDPDVKSLSDWGGWLTHDVNDNLLQGDSTTFDVEFTLEQVH
ncbi:MAG: hypothetical protein HGB18_00250 [Candidatus Moranbacteria bacterium]|nr:hypothetical protein [Candidatus Moranbacteria bacterium]